jgi:hypothetical protein
MSKYHSVAAPEVGVMFSPYQCTSTMAKTSRRAIRISTFLVVGLLSAVSVIPAHADWMTQMMQQQMLYQQQGDAAVRRLYYNCITHPGTCRPAPGALEDANRRLQDQYDGNFRASQSGYARQYNAINRWDDAVIKGCQYWQNPYTGQVYTNNPSCR